MSVLDEEETGTYPNSWTAQLKSALSILLDVLLAFWMEPCFLDGTFLDGNCARSLGGSILKII